MNAIDTMRLPFLVTLIAYLYKFRIIGGYTAPGALTLCLDESITTPLIIFPKVRKRDANGEMSKLNYQTR